ncbi:MAG: VacB/RNase II family 3'-5' exoribonuclease [Candidatus Aegiribacteria sp.]|nr:VacB/RNase II family 3'-5' exoribonuclease [Candidatus Aegiribacteria sp.]
MPVGGSGVSGSKTETLDTVLELFQCEPSSRLTFRQIAARLEGEHPDLSGAVEQLVDNGQLWPAGGGRYALPSELGISAGTIIIRADGSGFVKTPGERIEIDARNAAGSLDGDLVMVRKLETLPGEGRYRGKVETVLKRCRQGISGIARKKGRKWVIDPVNPVLPREIVLRTVSDSDISQGRLVFATLDYSGKKLAADLKKDLGSPSSPGALIDSVVLDHGLHDEFPLSVVKIAEELASEPWSLEGRKDFRDLLTVTIDPVDAKDFDDAVSLLIEDDIRILYVHIADVAHYVASGSQIDNEAELRGTSVYLPDRVLPMLPQVLSNGACSLKPDEERPTRTVVMKFDKSGERLEFTIVPSVIRSDRRMTYEEALEYLEGHGTGEELRQLFDSMGILSADLDSIRLRRGALDLGSSEYRVVFGEDGWPEGFRPVPSDRAHRMIENFMVEANRAVADHCMWSDLPVLFRVHDEPVSISEERLVRQLAQLEIALPGGKIHSPSVLKKILDNLVDSPLHDLAVEYILRSMQKAVYLPSNTGHFGLALRSYLHFTSPIRRYPDLLVHQALAMQEKGEIPVLDSSPSELAESSNASEDNAESAEREADELMAMLFLSRNIGKTFNGVVTGVKNFGVFVRLEGVPVEGLAHRSDILRASIPFTESGGPYHEGSLLRVEVLTVDPMKRKLSLKPLRE